MAEVGGSYQPFLTQQQQDELIGITRKILNPGCGILTVDDTPDAMGQKLSAINLENNKENRRRYKQLLFTTPNLDEHVSGIILAEEDYYQKTDQDERFVDLLKRQGVVPGIKVDTGIASLGGTIGEGTTQSLDDLAKRCIEFKKALIDNANVTARYASIAQQNGIVPIVEPDVLRDGDHDLVSEQVLAYTYKALADHHVFLEGTILKTNFVVPGVESAQRVTPEQVGLATVMAFRRAVPPVVPGIGFLSGGLSELESTQYLNAVNQVNLLKPWVLTFCFGRSMQASVTKTWHGKDANLEKAQKILLQRAKANGDAQLGQYTGEDSLEAAAKSLFIAKHVY